MGGGFFGGLAGGYVAGNNEKDWNGSLIDRFKKAFGKADTSGDEQPGSDRATDTTSDANRDTSAMHKGGRVPKNGTYRLKKNEVVLSAPLVKAIEARDKRTKGKRTVARKSGRGSSRR